jgi:sensor histidine kinase YesM
MNGHYGGSLSMLFTPAFLLFLVFYPALFYVNELMLMPAFYLRKRYLSYFVIMVVLFVLVILLKPFDQLLHMDHRMPPPPGGPRGPGPDRGRPVIDIVSIILFIMTWSFSTALFTLRQWRNSEQRIARAEFERTNAELSFLKAQINPHFLFNTLNNIYAMSVSGNAYTSTAIMKLSNIMRYVTDEASHQFVPLQQEVSCIMDYIDLQRMRLNEKTVVNFTVTGDVKGKSIPPLLLMTFVENVFKYGVSSHEEATINITLSTGGNNIQFLCTNKIFAAQSVQDRTGIGIANSRQRLQSLYPGRHRLEIKDDGKNYSVDLTLEA